MHDGLPMLHRRIPGARELSPFRRRLLALCGETNPVHPTPVGIEPISEGGTLSIGSIPSRGAWLARGGNQINGKACRVAGGAARKEGVSNEL